MSDKAGGIEPTFKELESEGWERNASTYHDYAGQVTLPAIREILRAVRVGANMRLLDVGCGPGYAAGEAANLGAKATGIDIAQAMLTGACERYPNAHFEVGDAEKLSYRASSFEAVICAFGLLHLSDPDKALSEFGRVLVPGGSLAFTVWCGPDKHEFFALVLSAMQKYGSMDVGLPSAPPTFRFSDHAECERALEAAGFVDVAIQELPLRHQTSSCEDLLNLVYRSTVRTAMVLERQTPAATEAIHQAIRDGAELYKTGEVYELKWPAVLAIARKP